MYMCRSSSDCSDQHFFMSYIRMGPCSVVTCTYGRSVKTGSGTYTKWVFANGNNIKQVHLLPVRLQKTSITTYNYKCNHDTVHALVFLITAHPPIC